MRRTFKHTPPSWSCPVPNSAKMGRDASTLVASAAATIACSAGLLSCSPSLRASLDSGSERLQLLACGAAALGAIAWIAGRDRKEESGAAGESGLSGRGGMFQQPCRGDFKEIMQGFSNAYDPTINPDGAQPAPVLVSEDHVPSAPVRAVHLISVCTSELETRNSEGGDASPAFLDTGH